ncbi:MAG: hypothetical protein JO037_11000 [Actinobacteria bacterium]|nr:hypothetical protein [Actinomycetota bacterium]
MRKYLATAGLTAAILGLGIPGAQARTGGEKPPSGVVSPTPAANTPHLANSSDPVEQIRQVVQCGGTMYAVGSFSSILQGSKSYPRTDIFSFSATAPYTVTSWAPRVVGSTATGETGADAINSIAFAGGNCADAYIGGHFTSVNGTKVTDIAEISTSTGNVVSGFAHTANAGVDTLLAVGGHLLAGGDFTSVNGSSADPYFASLKTTTGADDGFMHLSISGHYVFPGVAPNTTHVYNQQLSHGGTLDLVEGDFTSVGGRPRQQIFMLNVAGSKAAVTGWTSPEFSQDCATIEPFYVRAAAWSPGDSAVFIGTTGFHPFNKPTGSFPRTGLCDAAASFPATQTSVSHNWINYAGCDSLFSAAADRHAAYFGGHERWSMNPVGCDFQGTGAIPAPGMEGLDPANGALFVNSAGSAGFYSRGRGFGADDMLVTSAGLWIASDNAFAASTCGGVSGHAGLCLLPY